MYLFSTCNASVLYVPCGGRDTFQLKVLSMQSCGGRQQVSPAQRPLGGGNSTRDGHERAEILAGARAFSAATSNAGGAPGNGNISNHQQEDAHRGMLMHSKTFVLQRTVYRLGYRYIQRHRFNSSCPSVQWHMPLSNPCFEGGV